MDPAIVSSADNQLRLFLREECGLAHESQVIEIQIPEEVPERFEMENMRTGVRWPGQRATDRPGIGYLLLALAADAECELVLREVGDETGSGSIMVRPAADGRAVEIGNGRVALRCFLGDEAAGMVSLDNEYDGPVLGMRIGNGAWRGGTFFDCRSQVVRRRGDIVEAGWVRVRYRFVAELAGGGRYEMIITLDHDAVMARVSEVYSTDEGDQLVWDFSGNELPEALHVLDATAGMASRPVDYCLDRRHARLWCWTQQSQLFDLVDGFAVSWAGGDAAGAVALSPGDWRGARLNHLEVWSRRWEEGARWTRRRTPADARADAVTGPWRIPARGEPVCRPRLTWEAWLGRGRREFGLVLTRTAELWPKGRGLIADPLGHFETEPTPERYAASQCMLRRLHVQHGVFPLQKQLATTWNWAEEPVGVHGDGAAFDESVRGHIPFWEPDPGHPANIAQMKDYLAARVLGFWDGSGIAYSNPVVGRRIAPYMAYYEWLAARGALAENERRRLRAWFVFLAELFGSDAYYPGDVTMRPLGDPDGVEPTLRGMANQNFYTDAFNVAGMAAQVFAGHPSAGIWRNKAVAHWGRQLDHHVYPESGVWEESHTYYLHVLHTINPLLLRWRRDGVADFYADGRMQKMVGASLAQLTPRDATHGGLRHLLAWGDHEAGHKVTPAILGSLTAYAEEIAEHAPELGAHLAWMIVEMGGDIHGLSPRRPEWRSGEIPALGFVFRDGRMDEAAGETMVALRAGAAWGHHHNDDGSLQVFARGRTWVTDACHGHVPERGRRKFAAAGHSRSVPAGLEPANYLWRFSRGWIAQSDASGALKHAVAWLPIQLAVSPLANAAAPLNRPLFAMRAVVQLTETLYAVIDEHDGQRDHEVVFHVATEQVRADGACLRGEAIEGAIQLISVSAQETKWRVEPADIPASGDLTHRTFPCHLPMGETFWHLTLMTILAPGEAGPVVTYQDDAVRVESNACVFSLRRKAGAKTSWQLERSDQLSECVEIPVGF